MGIVKRKYTMRERKRSSIYKAPKTNDETVVAGLANTGNSCYLINAVIQGMRHLELDRMEQ